RHRRDDEHPTVGRDLELGLGVDVRFLEERLVEDEREAVAGPNELLAHGTYRLPHPYVRSKPLWLMPRPVDQPVASAGKRTVNVEPRPGSDSTSMRPLSARAISLQMARPSPVPFPEALVVKKGSKMCRFTSGPIPLPVSATR